MKDNISHAVCRAALVSGLGVLCFGSAWADMPASAYVQNGLVIQYDGFAALKDGKLANLGSAGDVFDLTPFAPAQDKVADGWIRTETGWGMSEPASSAVTSASGYSIECYGKQTGIGSKDANYYFMVSTSVKDFSNTGDENIPISLGTAGVDSIGMYICGLSATWNGFRYMPYGKVNGSVLATRSGTVDASGSKTIAYYENGAKIGSAASGGIVNEGIKRINLGDLRAQRGCYWIGDIGSVRVYNRVLTATEIAYNATVDRVRFSSQASRYTGVRMWTGLGADADWETAANWIPEGAPVAGELVVIPKNAAVTLSAATAQLGSIEISGTLTFSGWTSTLSASTVVVTSTGKVTSLGGVTAEEDLSRVHLVCADCTLQKGGTINVNGKGYDCEMNGPCWEIATGTKKNGYCSGVYGGDIDVPYFNDDLIRPHPYGSIRWPLDPGSGAASNGGLTTEKRSGGGAVLIEATGNLVLDGTISADGIEPWVYCGGGSGGAVAIRCRTISGSGRISADAKDYNTNIQVIYGGGGGRIAVEYDPAAQASVSCGVRFTAHGGATRMGSSEGGRYHYVSGCGSIWFPDLQMTTRSNLNLGGVLYTGDSPTPVTSLSFDGPLVLDGCRLEFLADDVVVTVKGDCGLTGTVTRAYGIAFRGRNAKLTVGGNLEMKGASVRAKDGLDLQVAGNVIQPEGTLNGTASDLWIGAGPTNGVDQAFGATVTIGGAWTMGNGCAYAPVCQPTNGAVVYAKAQSVQFASNAYVSASSAGYWYAWRKGSCGQYAGGDHGGLGGANTAADKAKGTVYGNKRMPLTPGSGAGDLYWSYSKYGGGVVAVETVGNMTIDCPISANGVAGQIYAGASAGGSIFLKCGGHLSGDPGVTLSANGGAADKGSLTTSTYGSGGGGGRIAVWYQTKDESVDGWTLSVEGGKCEYAGEGTPSQWGDAGTKYWRQWNKGLMLFVR